MQVEQVDFVSVPTRDVARAVAWYRDALGLPVSEYSPGEVETPNVTLSFWNPESDGEEFQASRLYVAIQVDLPGQVGQLLGQSGPPGDVDLLGGVWRAPFAGRWRCDVVAFGASRSGGPALILFTR